jgi:hypothetical protein
MIKTYIDISTVLNTIQGKTESESCGALSSVYASTTSSGFRDNEWQEFIRLNMPNLHKKLFTKSLVPPIYMPDHSTENDSEDLLNKGR